MRIELGLDGPPGSLAIDGKEGDFTLFKIQPGSGGPTDTVAQFGREIFHVATDPTGSDASDEALSIIAVPQALNSKATTLPAPVDFDLGQASGPSASAAPGQLPSGRASSRLGRPKIGLQFQAARCG